MESEEYKYIERAGGREIEIAEVSILIIIVIIDRHCHPTGVYKRWEEEEEEGVTHLVLLALLPTEALSSSFPGLGLTFPPALSILLSRAERSVMELDLESLPVCRIIRV